MKVLSPLAQHSNMYRTMRKFTTFFNGFVCSAVDLDLVKVTSRYTDDLGPVAFCLVGIYIRVSVHIAAQMITTDVQAALDP